MEGHNVYISLIERGTNLLTLVGNQMETDSAAADQELNDILDSADRIISTVGVELEELDHSERTSEKSMREAALSVSDAKLISICCSIAKGKAESIDANLDSFHPGVFTDNVVSLMEASVLFTYQKILDWTRLDEAATNCFRVVPSFTPMLGALPNDPTGPPRERKTRAAAAPVAQTRRPINVTSEDNTEKEDEGVDEIVMEIWKTLRIEYKRNKSKPVCYFRFLVDPRSFGASVENMFYMAFLIKENRVLLEHDKRGMPVLTPQREKNTGGGATGSAAENEQMITSLCPDQWEEVIELLNIREPMLKRRLPEEDMEPAAGTSRQQ